MISGNESLQKYYPAGTKEAAPKPVTELGNMLSALVIHYCVPFKNLSDKVPPPHAVDPLSFYEVSAGRNSRPTFLPVSLAKYLAILLGPIHKTGESWFRYDGGVFRRIDEDDLKHVAQVALRDNGRPLQVNSAVETLGNLVRRRPEDWPRGGSLLNCANCMVDLKTGETFPHSPDYLSRTQIPSNFDPTKIEAAIPFLEYLEKSQPGKENEPCRIMLQRFGGYTLWPDNRFEVFLILKGEGGSGKGTFTKCLKAVLGDENCSALSLHDLGERFNTYVLQNSMINIGGEVNSKKEVEITTLKLAVSGESIKAEEKFGKAFFLEPRTKFIFAVNRNPRFQEIGHDLERRMIVVPFEQRFEGESKEPDLYKRLVEGDGRDGILYWMLVGQQPLWEAHSFELKGRVKDTTSAFMQSLDNFLIFVNAVCVLRPDAKARVKNSYDRYVAWCRHAQCQFMSLPSFSKRMQSLKGVYQKLEPGTKRSYFYGIEIRTEDEDEDF